MWTIVAPSTHANGANLKRHSTAALQDLAELGRANEFAAASWSAAVLFRFGSVVCASRGVWFELAFLALGTIFGASAFILDEHKAFLMAPTL